MHNYLSYDTYKEVRHGLDRRVIFNMDLYTCGVQHAAKYLCFAPPTCAAEGSWKSCFPLTRPTLACWSWHSVGVVFLLIASCVVGAAFLVTAIKCRISRAHSRKCKIRVGEKTGTSRGEEPVCSGRKHGEENGYGPLQIQGALDLFVRQVLHIRVFREERVRFSCGEPHVQHQHLFFASNSDQQCCNAARNGQIPLLWHFTRLHVVVGNENVGLVVSGEGHCHLWKGKVPWHFVRVVLRLTHKKKNGGHNVRNAVSNLVFHPLEDLHRQVTGFHDD